MLMLPRTWTNSNYMMLTGKWRDAHSVVAR